MSEIPHGAIESRAAGAWHLVDRFSGGVFDDQHDLRPRRRRAVEDIAEQGTEGRILSAEEPIANARALERRFEIHASRTRRQECAVRARGLVRGQRAEWRIVVHDVDAASERAEHDVVFSTLDLNVADRD
jgi:hypothetical protein